MYEGPSATVGFWKRQEVRSTERFSNTIVWKQQNRVVNGAIMSRVLLLT